MTETVSLTERNRAIAERIYAAAGAGDIDGLLACLADDVVVAEPPFLPFGKVYHGEEEFLELLASVGDYLDVSRITLR